jgi:hypothetical protein
MKKSSKNQDNLVHNQKFKKALQRERKDKGEKEILMIL